MALVSVSVSIIVHQFDMIIDHVLILLSTLCITTIVLSSQIINSKQPSLGAGLTQELLRMVTARVLVVLSGSFTSHIETGPTLT